MEEVLPKDVYVAMNEAIEITWGDEETSFVKAFETSFNKAIMQSRDGRIFAVNFVEILKELEMYIKGYERIQFVQAVRDANFHVFVGGDKAFFWEKYFKKQPNLVIHSSLLRRRNADHQKVQDCPNSCIKK